VNCSQIKALYSHLESIRLTRVWRGIVLPKVFMYILRLHSILSTKKYSLVGFKLRGFESASELYRSSDRRRSAKLLSTLVDRACHVVSATSLSDRNFDFLDLEPLLFLPIASQIVHEGEWTPFQTHCCSEKSGNAGNRARDLCVSSQKLWPLDHRGGIKGYCTA
jgi:hypothetical protein